MSETANGTSLSLHDVIQRFVDSERALEEAHERLSALAAAEQTQANAAAGLQSASAATRELVEAAKGLVAQSQEAQKTAREVLQAAAGLIDGTDLRELQTRLGSTDSTLKEGLERLEQLIGDAQTRDHRIAELETELARRTAVLTGRQRKKLGIQ